MGVGAGLWVWVRGDGIHEGTWGLKGIIGLVRDHGVGEMTWRWVRNGSELILGAEV